MTGVTHEHFQLVSNHLQAVHYSCHMSPTSKYLQNFSRHESLHMFFVNLDVYEATLYHPLIKVRLSTGY